MVVLGSASAARAVQRGSSIVTAKTTSVRIIGHLPPGDLRYYHPRISYTQALTYLKLSGCRQALLINFNVQRLADGIKSFLAKSSSGHSPLDATGTGPRQRRINRSVQQIPL